MDYAMVAIISALVGIYVYDDFLNRKNDND